MSDGINMRDDELDCEGIEVPGGEIDPLADLVAWTEEVQALERASTLFPSLEPVIDDNGYFGPSADVLTSYGRCWLLCGTRTNAVQVFDYLRQHGEELNLIPDLEENKAVVYIRKFEQLPLS